MVHEKKKKARYARKKEVIIKKPGKNPSEDRPLLGKKRFE